MKDIYFSWVLTIIALLTFIVSRIGIPIFMCNWRAKIKSFIRGEDNNNSKSLTQANLIEARNEKLGFIVQTVAIIELLVFGGLTLLLFNEKPSLSALSIAKTFGAFLGGWLTLKILGDYRPWSDDIAGKAWYHTSLIGTLFNVTTGFITGWITYVAWFSSY